MFKHREILDLKGTIAEMLAILTGGILHGSSSNGGMSSIMNSLVLVSFGVREMFAAPCVFPAITRSSVF